MSANRASNVVVLGGDGFCGWPTSLRLSRQGFNVTIVDNLVRRKTDVELGTQSLTPISPIDTRLAAWREVTGQDVCHVDIDIAEDYASLVALLRDLQPQAVVHFGEQRAAPYSMKSPRHKRYTIDNNINATHNLLCGIVETGLDIHVVHLGTMGVYGYGTAGLKIPEGYLPVQVEAEGVRHEMEIIYPPNPGSVYHMTKTLDALMFFYYNKNDQVRITDLHQGIVWGTNTADTLADERLVNRFDYEGDYGTVLNRFLMQSVVGHPITVYGTGGQTRAFIHIRDTARCVNLAIDNPPERGERVKIFNQVTETHRVRDLAQLVGKLTGAEVRYYTNPRNEALENDLRVENRQFLDLGLDPVTLSEGLLEEVIEVARRYADRCDPAKIIADSTWRADIPVDRVGSQEPNLWQPDTS
ncbi:MAG: NAD-dependent epimerase/dehydratase family protein [Caldilineaceae bacterium SB0662_bin_9]|uniref:NAD-dependent epimerase/dehydratase family protein n=1 Tax=Caldilineaceae bacterium SB0662_bin_9 TaxID=2605258 RepID=A0A6B1DVD0_9CHLR|nr:NAD-dependent epimerase/dehydratase family protein [Caldilineaceae bacterium]MYD90633.1 NAD-dependent epimerase/dehydratase family protein [Caldilineaceae bacterium SB0662_bin_9]